MGCWERKRPQLYMALLMMVERQIAQPPPFWWLLSREREDVHLIELNAFPKRQTGCPNDEFILSTMGYHWTGHPKSFSKWQLCWKNTLGYHWQYCLETHHNLLKEVNFVAGGQFTLTKELSMADWPMCSRSHQKHSQEGKGVGEVNGSSSLFKCPKTLIKMAILVDNR